MIKKFKFVKNLKASADSRQISYGTLLSTSAPRTKLKFDNSKFAQVRQFRANSRKIPHPKKIECPLSVMAKLGTLSIYYICVEFQDVSSNFGKVRATINSFQKIQNPIKSM